MRAKPPNGSPGSSTKKLVGSRGVSLPESLAALALAGLGLAGSMQGLSAAAMVTRHTQVQLQALALARNSMETALGSPCGANLGCSAGFSCQTRRQLIGVPGLERLTISVSSDTGSVLPGGADPALVRLSTLVVQTPTCGAS